MLLSRHEMKQRAAGQLTTLLILTGCAASSEGEQSTRLFLFNTGRFESGDSFRMDVQTHHRIGQRFLAKLRDFFGGSRATLDLTICRPAAR
ncbi:hypothetical protein E4U50_001460 [Claviceps purpurea]|nr:hypothetical protein E4U50_001460 [Claviceps purpurea]